MIYKKSSLSGYLNDLAAKLPAPGGGSAAALCAALAAGLVSMVANFTLGKPKYARYQRQVSQALDKSEKLRHDFLRLVDLDVRAYKSKNLRNALQVPFMLARLSFEGIKLCPPLIKKGNQNLISDVAVAAVMFEAAFASAVYNVDINLKMLGDKKLSANIKKELRTKAKQVKKIRTETEAKIGKVIGS